MNIPSSNFTWLHTLADWEKAPNDVRRDFTEYMSDKCFGQAETVDAFHHFYAGWMCLRNDLIKFTKKK